MTWTSAVWTTVEFREELRDFVAPVVGEPTVLEPLDVRPWSTVWRVESAAGVHYAKQNCPGQAHEAALVVELARIAPERVAPVAAADPARDLLLTPDLGPTLRASGAAADPDVWCRIVAEAAALQREVATHVAELPLRVLLPADATTYVADAVGRLAALPAGDARRLRPEEALRIEALLPDIGEWSDEVADLGLPITLNHNDLHDNNVIAPAGDASLRFFDFGDAVLAEPLGSLLIPLRFCADVLGAGPDDPRLHRVVDAALEVWTDVVPAARMRAALPAALQLGRLARAESWRRCVASMTLAERGEYGAAPAEWLGTLGEDPPVGTRPRM
ncbi:hypothetical protein HNR19_001644 [Nocardioides thalensis]|uniref:Aminoglycoside phosphotransferase domain-containing protein n=1 Tax=Nocardioides thalensis TaxID=1914755 RepID=A0A853C1S4_9ACTN|nr:hypothetical protein [Nocardioides thalensis]NYJ00946.1 hypothetical protein [Nocardioides thalensis]